MSTIKEKLRKADVFNTEERRETVKIPRKRRSDVPGRIRLGRSLEPHRGDWRLLRQLEEKKMNYEYIMATHPKWYLKVYYKNQIYYGFYGMLCDLIGATENREDYELHEELVRRVNIAKGVGLKKDQIFEFMSILAWAIGEKKGNWAEKPVSQQFDIPRAVIDEKYEELRGIPETD